jgi:segregation and condensation protein B
MSLRAKLEAVIYAAEEPVTLSQLAALFAVDALEWKAEQEVAAADAATLAAAPRSQALPMLAEGLEYLGLEQTPDFYLEPKARPDEPVAEHATQAGVGTEANAGTAVNAILAAAEVEPAESVAEPAPALEAPLEAEAAARHLARQRDREVKTILRQLLEELMASYSIDGHGVEIREIAGGYRMATKPECHDAVRLFIKSLKPPMKLSLPALETLAVIAYKQPVTAPEVNEIRGVDSAGVFGSLLARKLISTAGRKQVIGRPILYKTTKEFLLRFGLKDVSELPSMEEFEKMAAVELSEGFDEQQPASGFEPVTNVGPELDENASEEPDEDASLSAAEPAPAEPAETENHD